MYTPATFIRLGSPAGSGTPVVTERTNCGRDVSGVVTTSHGDEANGSFRVTPWLPAVVIAVVVLIASVVPVPATAPVADQSVGLGFTAVFLVVGYAVLAASLTRGTGRSLVGVAAAAGVATAFGFGIELLQAPIPWRSFAWLDVLLNAIGAVFGVTAVAVELNR